MPSSRFSSPPARDRGKRPWGWWRRAIGAGIGLFIAFIGAVNARLVVVPEGTIAAVATNPDATLPPVAAGSLSHPDTLIAHGFLAYVAIAVCSGRAREVRPIIYGVAVAFALSFWAE